ncbi:hypothetical protein [Arthrobacter sp. ISL-72]|uniref:hypothetical protein n=1 Tax=Arthrobacter sp. ISL-72 TaxID=2819114 RepID=UPI001BE83142|nr:hypothetical protein [Arthrobacter sp. ISL-72]MBT2598119.1 hypothetical protein [Arthrobacter sp. ISL-72]
MASQFPIKPPASPPPVGVNQEGRRRLNRIAYFGGALALAMITLNFLPIDSEPWVWIKLAVFAAGTTLYVIWVTRFSLWQRDEYWRERGRNPKHPQRFPKQSDEK